MSTSFDLTPLQPSESETGHLIRQRIVKKLIIFLTILAIPVIGAGAMGVYDVPVVSSLFGADKPKDLGIKVSDEAYASIQEKIPMKISGEKVDYVIAGQSAFTGSIDIDTKTTSEEITSWLAKHEGTNPIFTRTQVKKFEGGLEISTMLHKYTTAPVYVKVLVTQTGPKSVTLSIQQAKLGRLNVPEKYRLKAEKYFQDKIFKIMSSIEGFSIDTYAIHEDSSTFKGTFPAIVAPSRQGWSGLFNL